MNALHSLSFSCLFLALTWKFVTKHNIISIFYSDKFLPDMYCKCWSRFVGNDFVILKYNILSLIQIWIKMTFSTHSFLQDWNPSPLFSEGTHPLSHSMRAITRSHASTRATSLMRVKNSTRHLCLWHLWSGTLERRKWKNEQNHQI